MLECLIVCLDALQQTNSFDLAQQANPYAYLGGNAAGALAQWIGTGEGAGIDDWLTKDVGNVVENIIDCNIDK